MSQETTIAVEELRDQGNLDGALRETFPEYRSLLQSATVTAATQIHAQSPTQSQKRTPFKSRSLNLDDDLDSTPRPSKTYQAQLPRLPGYTIPSILFIPHLQELAGLVVDEQSRKEEKRRRRRIRDGTATPKDQSQSQGRSLVIDTQSSSKSQGGWRLSNEEKRARMERLVKWVIRGLSEEGVLVQIKLRIEPNSKSDFNTPSFRPRERYTEAYLPLPESLLLPLLIPHVSAESEYRKKIYIPRSDHRYGNGILLEEVLKRLRECGEEGRWERVGEFCVEDALNWGVGKGLKRLGSGWILS